MAETDQATRKIIHVDMDAFFAAVEQLDNPKLRGKPVAVGGSPEGRGVVAAASYEARKYGLRSAMSAKRAKNLCPHVIFVRPNFKRYKEISRVVRKIFYEVTEDVEPISIDEAFLDVTENKLKIPSATLAAIYIKSRIRGQTRLTASAGAAPNKFIAKIASDLKKPNGLVVVPPDKVQKFLHPLTVDKLWGAGPKTVSRLNEAGLETIGDVARLEKQQLIDMLGKPGGFFWHLARGEDNREVSARRIAKSRSSETTFAKDVTNICYLERAIAEQAEDVAKSLERMQTKGRTVTLKVRYKNFKTITRSTTLITYASDSQTIAETACTLLKKTAAGRQPVRLIGVGVHNLLLNEKPRKQLSLPWQEDG